MLKDETAIVTGGDGDLVNTKARQFAECPRHISLLNICTKVKYAALL